MLIITRRPQEKIIIGDDIEITVLSMRGNQVRLGIHAPKNVSVNREEVHWRVIAEKAAVLTKKSTRAKELES